jgi:hypothetical protein
MIKIPHDAEQLMHQLPQEILDEIQLELLFWVGPALIEMGPTEPTEKQMKKYFERLVIKQTGLLRAAKVKLDKERGV